MMRAINRKNRVIAKHKRYTAKYPTAAPQSTVSLSVTIPTRLSEGPEQNGTFCRAEFNPGLNIMHAVMVPSSSIMAYIILEELEFLQEGQA